VVEVGPADEVAVVLADGPLETIVKVVVAKEVVDDEAAAPLSVILMYWLAISVGVPELNRPKKNVCP
jgi:hypothetical protein